MLSVFTQEALLKIASIKDDASSSEQFLREVDDIAKTPGASHPYPFDTSEPDPLITSTRGHGLEAANARSVYEFLGPLDRTNASDGRLWTWLAFVTYRDYMEQRWPLSGENWRNRVNSRWLMLGASRERLVRHGIARLWWCAHLTFDALMKRPLAIQAQDPFAYTRAGLVSEDRFLNLFDRDLGSYSELRFALLDYLEANPDAKGETFTRELMKSVVRESGIRDLAALDRPQLDELISEAGQFAHRRTAGR